MKIGIILGSVREGRLGASIAEWVLQQAQDRQGEAQYHLIDLKEFNVPLYTAAIAPKMANKEYESAEVRAWSAAIDECDAFVYVTPEYNYSVPGAFKNACDSLGPEWMNKPVAFVGYSYHGAEQAIAAWRQTVAGFEMKAVEDDVNIFLGSELTDGAFAPAEHQAAALDKTLTALEALV